MDGVSAAGGIISIISLAIQFASGLKASYEFLAAVRDAPSDIQDLVAEIDLLRRILESLSRDVETSTQSLPLTLLADSVKLCQFRLQKLDDLAKPLVVDLKSRKQDRTWKSLKAAFRGKKIEQLRGILESAKTTLLLAKHELSASQSKETINALNSTIATLDLYQATAISEGFKSSREDVSGMTQRLENQLKNQVEIIVRQLPQATSRNESSATPQILKRVISQTVRTAFQESMLEIRASESVPGHPRKSRKLVQPRSFISTAIERKSRFSESCLTSLNAHDKLTTQESLCSMTSHQNNKCINTGMRLKRKRTTSWYKKNRTIFGTITFQATLVFSLHPGEDFLDEALYSPSIEFSFSFLPKPWLFSSVPFLSLSATRGQEYHLETSLAYYNRAPDDAEIFKACARGDLGRVQELLHTKKASIYDVTRRGETLLHISAEWGSISLCRFLLQNGVKSNVDLGCGTEFQRFLFWGTFSRDKHVEPVDLARLLVEHGSDPSLSFSTPSGWDSPTVHDNMQCVEYISKQDSFYVDINHIDNDMAYNAVGHYLLGFTGRRTWDHKIIKDLEIWRNLGASFREILYVAFFALRPENFTSYQIKKYLIPLNGDLPLQLRSFTSYQIKDILKYLIPLQGHLHWSDYYQFTVSEFAAHYGLLDEWYEALVESGIDLEAFKKEDDRLRALYWAREDNNKEEVARLEALAPNKAIHTSVDFTPADDPGYYRELGGFKKRRLRENVELE